jgi:hypothetical protein
MMDDRTLRGGPRFKQARAELDKSEQDFQDVDMLYNIMIIKMAYSEIDRYKRKRALKYSQIVKEYA